MSTRYYFSTHIVFLFLVLCSFLSSLYVLVLSPNLSKSFFLWILTQYSLFLKFLLLQALAASQTFNSLPSNQCQASFAWILPPCAVAQIIFAWVLPPCAVAQVVNWAVLMLTLFVSFLSGIIILCCLLSSIWKLLFLIFCSGFYLFYWEVKSGLCISILIGSRMLSEYCSLKFPSFSTILLLWSNHSAKIMYAVGVW